MRRASVAALVRRRGCRDSWLRRALAEPVAAVRRFVGAKSTGASTPEGLRGVAMDEWEPADRCVERNPWTDLAETRLPQRGRGYVAARK